MATFLGLGANLGDRLSALQHAIDLLAADRLGLLDRDVRGRRCRARRTGAPRRLELREPVAQVRAESQVGRHRLVTRSAAVAAAATPSMPIEPAAFGLCTTAVARTTWSIAEHGLGDGGGDRFQQVEGRAADGGAGRLHDRAVVRRVADHVEVDADLEVQVNDERLRRVLLAGVGPVTALAPDPG